MGFRNFATQLIRPMMTGATLMTARLRVDVGQTGFWEGREFRVNQPISIPAANTDGFVIKFVSPVNFILQLQSFVVRQDGLRFEAYRSGQGVEGGTFTASDYLEQNNAMDDTPAYTPQITIFDGGTFTPNGGEIPKEVVEVLAANATAQRTSVGGSAVKERGLPPGTYYLKFTNLNATGTTIGIYNLIYEERP